MSNRSIIVDSFSLVPGNYFEVRYFLNITVGGSRT
jgi:hypothetical protein